MGIFFNSTRTASDALYGDFKFKPYYNLGFHLDGIISMFCHILRTSYDLILFALHLVLSVFYILNPFAWIYLPGHAINAVDNALAFGISIITSAISPIIFVLRTLTSMIFGYEEGSDYDNGKTDEEADLLLAIKVF